VLPVARSPTSQKFVSQLRSVTPESKLLERFMDRGRSVDPLDITPVSHRASPDLSAGGDGQTPEKCAESTTHSSEAIVMKVPVSPDKNVSCATVSNADVWTGDLFSRESISTQDDSVGPIRQHLPGGETPPCSFLTSSKSERV
jgi:hypothetical protein